MARRKFTKKQILAAIENSGGIVSTIAKRMGVTWNTAKRYVELYEATRRAFYDEEEMILDMAEASLFKKIKNEDITSIKFLLSTKGKRRGYVIRQEITGSDGDSIEIDFTS